MMFLPFIIRYRHFLGYGLAVVALIASVWYIHHRGYEACQAALKAKELTIMEKRNEIARNRPDDTTTINRLRNGNF